MCFEESELMNLTGQAYKNTLIRRGSNIQRHTWEVPWEIDIQTDSASSRTYV